MREAILHGESLETTGLEVTSGETLKETQFQLNTDYSKCFKLLGTSISELHTDPCRD